MKRVMAVWLGLLCAVSVCAATKTEVSLIFSAPGVRPGDGVVAGIHFRLAPGWHTYWRNPGESGAGATIEWELPDGISAGEIQYPVPEKLVEAGPTTTYVFHDELLLLVPLKAAATAKGPAKIRAKVTWLECEKVCVMSKAVIEGTLEVADPPVAAKPPVIFETWSQRFPTTDPKLAVTSRWVEGDGSDSRALVISLDSPPSGEVDFFPFENDTYDVSPATERARSGGKLQLTKKIKKLEGEWPAKVAGLIVKPGAEGKSATGYTVELQPETLGKTGGKQAAATATPEGSRVAPPKAPRSLLAMLGLAFLGGLILNIMPCVLPVIALKILGFVNQSGENPRRIRQMGVIYALGVLTSFLLLAGVVIAVKEAGRIASWGMQFQNPQFLIAMLALVTLVALNLFGLFEINLSGRAMGAAGDLAAKEGSAGAFFNGVLATILATPCSAPFLGVALGFAFAQSAPLIILMFLAVGLGLASPYVVLSWQPGWLKFLPKPGSWMEKFKIAMGFPMLATAVWLYSLTLAHFPENAGFWLGIFLVCLGMAAWVWGEFVQRGSRRTTLAWIISLSILAFAYFQVLEKELSWRKPVRVEAGGNLNLAEFPGGIPWEKWSSDAVAKLRAEGKPIFVDFTARWCAICLANKRTSIEIPPVRQKLTEIGAVALLGDYSLNDPLIAKELQRFDRAAVPLVLVYPADPSAAPIVLPELLTPSIVLNALEQARAVRKTAEK